MKPTAATDGFGEGSENVKKEKELLRKQMEPLAEQSRAARERKKEFAVLSLIFAVLSVVCFFVVLMFEMDMYQKFGNLLALICSVFQFGWYLRAWLV